ncbi:MAG: ATP-binding protein, partial [Spirochaetaceae bacterium]
MLSVISSHALYGISGCIVQVEVDIRFGLPGIDIVGLPDSAVREARERVRVAIRNSGFEFPAQRILVSLAPAGIKKGGSAFDLPIALGILAASGQIAFPKSEKILVLGELNLSGKVGPARGVLTAVEAGLRDQHEVFLVPLENLPEARILCRGKIFAVTDLGQAAVLVSSGFTAGICDAHAPAAIAPLSLNAAKGGSLDNQEVSASFYNIYSGDFSDIK